MCFGKETVRISASLVLCLLLSGCFERGSLPLGAPLDAHGIAPRPRQTPNVPDLRLPAESFTAAEIPIVPLPLPPLERPAAVPVSNPKPAVPPPLPAATDAGPTLPARPAADMPPVIPPPPVGLDNARQLYKLAAERYEGMDSYIVRLTRREQVRGENKPEEVMLFKFRKEPWSVYLKWLGPTGRGREVIFVKGQYDNKIHTLLAAGDMPLAPAGKRMALSPDNLIVRAASRHPIDEAGLGASIERIGRILTALERGDQRLGTVTDLGFINRPEFPRAVPAVEHFVPAGADPALPRGGRRLYCFDPDNHLPVLLVTRDHLGQEVEYYFHDRLQFPVRLDDNDFNPDKVWGRPARQ